MVGNGGVWFSVENSVTGVVRFWDKSGVADCKAGMLVCCEAGIAGSEVGLLGCNGTVELVDSLGEDNSGLE